MSDDIDLTLLLRNLEARYLIEVWKIDDELRRATRNSIIRRIEQSMREVKKIIKKGSSCRKAAELIGVPYHSLNLYLRKKHKELLRNPGMRGGAVDLFNKGLPIQEISEITGQSIGAINKKLRNSGFESFSPPRNQKREAIKQDVFLLREDGLTMAEIAKKTGVSIATISNILSEHKQQCQSQPN